MIRNLIRQADLDALEQVVLDGHGQKLMGENASDSKIRTFIKAIPSYLVSGESIYALGTFNNIPMWRCLTKFILWDVCNSPLSQRKIEQLHEAVVNGDLKGVQNHLTRRKLALSKDENGHGLLHKVVYYGHRDIYDWMAKTYPETLETRDWVRRARMSFQKPFW